MSGNLITICLRIAMARQQRKPAGIKASAFFITITIISEIELKLRANSDFLSNYSKSKLTLLE